MRDERFSPSGLAQDAVNAWNSVDYGGDRYAACGPWNELVDRFGEGEAEKLVYLVLAARGVSNPSYEAASLESYVRARNEEAAAAAEDMEE